MVFTGWQNTVDRPGLLCCPLRFAEVSFSQGILHYNTRPSRLYFLEVKDEEEKKAKKAREAKEKEERGEREKTKEEKEKEKALEKRVVLALTLDEKDASPLYVCADAKNVLTVCVCVVCVQITPFFS